MHTAYEYCTCTQELFRQQCIKLYFKLLLRLAHITDFSMTVYNSIKD